MSKIMLVNMLSIIFIILSCESNNSVNNSIDDDLISFYKFNANVNDESENLFHGENYGAVFVPDRFNNENSAIAFNGIDQKVVFNDLANIPIGTAASDYSFSIWLKSDNPGIAYILDKWNGNINQAYPLAIRGSLTQTTSSFYDTVTSSSNLFGHIWDNSWHNLIVVVDSKKKTHSIYLNGTLYSRNSIKTMTSTFNTEPVTLGGKETRYYNGAADDLRFYNRTLSREEIKAIFNDK